MNLKSYTGIILYSGTNKKTISVLDSDLGKINLIINTGKKKLSPIRGGLIGYDLSKLNNIYMSSGQELISAPMSIAKEDILFLHHVIEICNSFLPINQPAREIFNLLLLLYKVPEFLNTCFKKKIFLVKLFNLLGIINEDIDTYSPSFYYLISEPIDIMLNKECDQKIHAELTRWLLDCISIHPRASQFNTIFFLTNS